MAPLQNMVIRPLHETWKKKEWVPFQGQTQSTIQHAHCHLSLKEVASKKCVWKADGLPYWVARAMLGCLDAGSQSRATQGFSNSGTEEFNFIISSTFDSAAPRDGRIYGHKSTSSIEHRKARAIKQRGPTPPLTLMKCVNQKRLPIVVYDENQFDTPSKRKTADWM